MPRTSKSKTATSQQLSDNTTSKNVSSLANGPGVRNATGPTHADETPAEPAIANKRAENLIGSDAATANERSITDEVSEHLDRARETVSETAADIGQRFEETKNSAREDLSEASDRASDFYDTVRRDVERAYADGYERGKSTYKQAASRSSEFARENPIAIGAMGLAAGLLIGALLPRTRLEDTKLGKYSDDVVDRVRETGEEALRQTRAAAESAVRSASETAQSTISGAGNENRPPN